MGLKEGSHLSSLPIVLLCISLERILHQREMNWIWFITSTWILFHSYKGYIQSWVSVSHKSCLLMDLIETEIFLLRGEDRKLQLSQLGKGNMSCIASPILLQVIKMEDKFNRQLDGIVLKVWCLNLQQSSPITACRFLTRCVLLPIWEVIPAVRD